MGYAAPGHTYTCSFVSVHASDQRQAALFLTNNFSASFQCLSDRLVTLMFEIGLTAFQHLPLVQGLTAYLMSWLDRNRLCCNKSKLLDLPGRSFAAVLFSQLPLNGMEL
jgi:uncharacterized membrane protein YfhO